MGCFCGKGTRVSDWNAGGDGSDVQVLNDAGQLIKLFGDFDDEKQKCVFVFGKFCYPVHAFDHRDDDLRSIGIEQRRVHVGLGEET